MLIRGVAAALNANRRYKYKDPDFSVDHLIIGGGVVGLAIAERLTKLYPHKSTFLVERHSRAGEETSSRNSEVIHAGIYYPPRSLKTLLCIRGRQLLYQRCLDYNVPHKRTGKLIVARTQQRGYLDDLITKLKSLPSSPSDKPAVPVELISGAEAREMQPDLAPDIDYAIHSPETGIIDSHKLIESFEKDIGESESGQLVYSTQVVRVDPYCSDISQGGRSPDRTSEGWVVQTVTSPASPLTGHRGDVSSESDADAFLARALINASGLNANLILNALLPAANAIPMYYARGSYASYRGPGVSHVSKLIYPVPDVASNGRGDAFKFQSLGTHLTLDMEGNVRFGPDIEWLSPPCPQDTPDDSQVFDESAIDFWTNNLVADENQERSEAMHRAITQYLPGVLLEGLKPDYVGVRPKLVGPRGGFQDFQVRIDRAGDVGGTGNAPMISLLGIESPGLTACLAIAEFVVNRLQQLTHDV